MIDAARNLTAASEVAHNNWAEVQRWKRLAERLMRELAERDAAADAYMEVRRGTVIFREVRGWQA
jgi:hypothetical protein